MENTKAVSTPLATHFKLSVKQSPSNEVEKTYISIINYTSMVGSLMYAIVCTRPDIAHVGTISWFLSNLGKEHWNVVKWILGYLRDTSDLKLCFGDDKPTLVVYSDLDIDEDIDSNPLWSIWLSF